MGLHDEAGFWRRQHITEAGRLLEFTNASLRKGQDVLAHNIIPVDSQISEHSSRRIAILQQFASGDV